MGKGSRKNGDIDIQKETMSNYFYTSIITIKEYYKIIESFHILFYVDNFDNSVLSFEYDLDFTYQMYVCFYEETRSKMNLLDVVTQKHE